MRHCPSTGATHTMTHGVSPIERDHPVRLTTLDNIPYFVIGCLTVFIPFQLCRCTKNLPAAAGDHSTWILTLPHPDDGMMLGHTTGHIAQPGHRRYPTNSLPLVVTLRNTLCRCRAQMPLLYARIV
jgi:hypothetical protein